MGVWEIYKSTFCKEFFNKPKKVNVTEPANDEKRCFINKLMKKYAYKFADIIISGTNSIIQFIKQRCCKNHFDTVFNPKNSFKEEFLKCAC